MTPMQISVQPPTAAPTAADSSASPALSSPPASPVSEGSSKSLDQGVSSRTTDDGYSVSPQQTSTLSTAPSPHFMLTTPSGANFNRTKSSSAWQRVVSKASTGNGILSAAARLVGGGATGSTTPVVIMPGSDSSQEKDEIKNHPLQRYLDPNRRDSAENEKFIERLIGVSQSETANLHRLGITGSDDRTYREILGKLRLTNGLSGDMASILRDTRVHWSFFDIFENDMPENDKSTRRLSPVIRAFSRLAGYRQVAVTFISFWSIWYVTLLVAYWPVLVGDKDVGRTTLPFRIFQWIDVVFDVMYLFGTIARLRITSLDPITGSESCRPKDLLRATLLDPLFYGDLLTCVPWSFLGTVGALPLWLSCFKIVRGWHLLRESPTQLVFQNSLQSVLMLFSSVMMLGHLLSCAFFVLLFNMGSAERHPNFPVSEDGSGMASDRAFLFHYSYSFKFGVYLGLGIDVTGYSMAENLLIAACTPLGATVSAIVMSQMFVLFTRASALETAHVEKASKIRQGMATLGLPSCLQLRILAFNTYERIHRSQTTFNALFKGLSAQLNFELRLVLYYELLTHVPIFRKSQPKVLRELVLVLEDVLFLPGDYVCRHGDEGTEMFFICKGGCSIIRDDMTMVIRRLDKGDYFGEVSLLTGAKRTAFVRADVFSTLAALKKEVFDQIMKSFPQQLEVIISQMTEGQRQSLKNLRKESQHAVGFGRKASIKENAFGRKASIKETFGRKASLHGRKESQMGAGLAPGLGARRRQSKSVGGVDPARRVSIAVAPTEVLNPEGQEFADQLQGKLAALSGLKRSVESTTEGTRFPGEDSDEESSKASSPIDSDGSAKLDSDENLVNGEDKDEERKEKDSQSLPVIKAPSDGNVTFEDAESDPDEPAHQEVEDAPSKSTVSSGAMSISDNGDGSGMENSKDIVMKGPSDLILGGSRGSLKPKRASFDGNSFKMLSSPLKFFNKSNVASSSSNTDEKATGAQSAPLPESQSPVTKPKRSSVTESASAMLKKLVPSSGSQASASKSEATVEGAQPALRKVWTSSESSAESLDHDSRASAESPPAHNNRTPPRLSSPTLTGKNQPNLKKVKDIQSGQKHTDGLEPFKNHIEDLTKNLDKMSSAKLAWVKVSEEICSESPTLLDQVKELRTLWEAKHKEAKQDAKDTDAAISELTVGMQAACDEVGLLLDDGEDEEDDLVARAIDVVKSQADKEKQNKKANRSSWRGNRGSFRRSSRLAPGDGNMSPMSDRPFGASESSGSGARRNSRDQQAREAVL